jgi:Tol biopolymer transport system component
LEFEVGSFLGPYQILDRIGAGGMGEVYRARDPRLSRDVAVKVLTASGPIDPARLHRFQQEARAAAALSHPNILSVFDVGSHEGIPYLVFELLEGETLSKEIARGGLTARKAIDYAIQIADGLSAAHDKGIIHRDVKPGNIFVTSKGAVKILDLGLAKLREPLDVTPGGSRDPTAEMSTPGFGVGTLGYMSPEQILGLPVDGRSDIFCLGAVLHEMLSGRRAFPHAPAEATQAILREDPPPLARTHREQPALAGLVRRCLEKSPALRFQSAHDVGLALRLIAEQDEGRGPRVRRRHWVAAGLIVLLASSGLAWRLLSGRGTGAAPADRPRVVPLTTFPGREFQAALSRDGQYVAFVWDGENGENLDIYNRPVGTETTLRLTSDPGEDNYPAWSPDGSWIAFIRVSGREAAIFVVSSAGGHERKLRSLRTWFGSSLDWSPDGKNILFTDGDSASGPFGIFLLSPETLGVRRLTNPSARYLGDAFPAFSPQGETVAFARLSPFGGFLLGAELALIPATGGQPRLVDTEPSLIGGLDWSPDGREVIFSSSRTGFPRLWRVAVAGGAPRRLWEDEGPELSNTTPAEAIGQISRAFRVSLSRKGHRLVYARGFYDTDIWKVEAPGPKNEGRPATKLIATTRLEEAPQFSPDGGLLAFASTRTTAAAQIWICRPDGTACTQVTSFDVACGTPRWSADGRQIVFDAAPDGHGDIFTVEISTRLVRRITATPSWESVPSWSRDGRWIYFASDRTASWQIWKVPAEGGSTVQVTSAGGFAAQESTDGRQVYYTKPSSAGIWQLPVEGGAESAVLNLPQCWGHWAVATNGLYVIDTTRGATIEFFAFSGGRPTGVAIPSGGPPCGEAGLAVSPDGRWIAYVDAVRTSDLMLVEGFS